MRNSALTLGTVANCDVGTGPGQVPSMDQLTQGAGWVKLPSGYILQWGTFDVTQNLNSVDNVTEFRQWVNFPIAFPTAAHLSLSKWDSTAAAEEYILQYYEPALTSFSVIVGYGKANVPQQSNLISFFAVGY